MTHSLWPLSLLGLNVPRVDFSLPEPQKHAIFTDFGSDLRKNGAFRGKVCSLEVGTDFEKLQFTFSSLVDAGWNSQDTYDSDFWVAQKSV